MNITPASDVSTLDMVEIAVQHANALQINFLMAKIEQPDWDDEMALINCTYPEDGTGWIYSPATDVAQSWPAIKRARIHLCPILLNGEEAWQCWTDGMSGLRFTHTDPLIAALRCHIVCNMGDMARIPASLIESAS